VLHIFVTVLDPSNPSFSPQVTEARNELPFIFARQRNSRTFDRQQAEVRASTVWTRSTVGLHESAKISLNQV